MKNKKIEISKETQACLDNLRGELVEIISRENNLNLMKKLENCSYDRLIFLLNIGFSEKAFFDTINGKAEMKIEEVMLSEFAKNLLAKMLEEKLEERKSDKENDNKGKENDKENDNNKGR